MANMNDELGATSAETTDPGSKANDTVDGLDAETEVLRHATEDEPIGQPGKPEKRRYLTEPIYRPRFRREGHYYDDEGPPTVLALLNYFR